MTEYDKKRRVTRYGFVVDVEVTDLASKIQLKGRTKEIALYGCGISDLSKFAQGTRVKVKLIREGAEVEAYGKIVYARPDLGTGIAFTAIESKDEQVLSTWIDEVASHRDPQHELK